MLETYLAGKVTEKRQNFDPSTPPACAKHFHFTLNGETRSAPRPPPDARSLERHGPQGELSGYMVLLQTTLGQISIVPWTDQPPPREKKRN
jgi:hypothetical protein